MKNDSNIGVYQIELNGKRYIGSTTKSFRIRWRSHLSKLKCSSHENPYLQNAYNKYGEDILVFSILETTDIRENCLLLEQKWIDSLKPEYNICPTAGNCLGRKFTKETKLKMSNAWRGRKVSEETKKRISEALKGNTHTLGYKHTKESRKKMSEFQKHNNKGKKRTEEQNKRNSEVHKKAVVQLSTDGGFIKSYAGATDATKETGINPSHIGECCMGKAKTAGGFKWVYK